MTEHTPEVPDAPDGGRTGAPDTGARPANVDPKTIDQRGSEVLSPAVCHRLLDEAARGVGRLGFALAGAIVVLPLNFMRYDGDVLLRLGPGSTLEALAAEPSVGFEIDRVETVGSAAPEAWSVLVQGRASVVREQLEFSEATALGLTPLVPEAGEVYVRIRTEHISGRRFPVGALGRYTLGQSA